MILSSGAYLVIIPFIKNIAMDRGMSAHVGVIAVMLTGRRPMRRGAFWHRWFPISWDVPDPLSSAV